MNTKTFWDWLSGTESAPLIPERLREADKRIKEKMEKDKVLRLLNEGTRLDPKVCPHCGRLP